MKIKLLILLLCCSIFISCGSKSAPKHTVVAEKKNVVSASKIKKGNIPDEPKSKTSVATPKPKKLDTPKSAPKNTTVTEKKNECRSNPRGCPKEARAGRDHTKGEGYKNIVFNTKVIYETSDASKSDNEGYFINFKYPEMDKLGNRELQNAINNDIKAKIETLTKSYKKYNQVVSSEFSTGITKNLLSIKFIISLDKPSWPPVNKPIYKIMTLNYDLNSGKEIHVESLFKPSSNYLQIISGAALADLKEQLKNSSDLANISEASIKEMIAPKSENYRNFLFNSKGITFIFANDKMLYHKANYPKVLILYGKIENLFLPSGPLAKI